MSTACFTDCRTTGVWTCSLSSEALAAMVATEASGEGMGEGVVAKGGMIKFGG